MSERQSREERAAALRALLQKVQVAECWQPLDPSSYIDVAVRRWTSSGRRIKPSKRTPENQIRDLLRGFREAQSEEDLIYGEPGWLEHLAERFGAALLAADQADETAAPPSR
ncbi:hypothetical protein [Micromonospora sp. NPDC023644]|uniref:hypothetical protein n=1 Tax=Micromonospora sp. NPDC023644 TaxID=3154321 RepID=UPI0033F05D71